MYISLLIFSFLFIFKKKFFILKFNSQKLKERKNKKKIAKISLSWIYKYPPLGLEKEHGPLT